MFYIDFCVEKELLNHQGKVDSAHGHGKVGLTGKAALESGWEGQGTRK